MRSVLVIVLSSSIVKIDAQLKVPQAQQRPNMVPPSPQASRRDALKKTAASVLGAATVLGTAKGAWAIPPHVPTKTSSWVPGDSFPAKIDNKFMATGVQGIPPYQEPVFDTFRDLNEGVRSFIDELLFDEEELPEYDPKTFFKPKRGSQGKGNPMALSSQSSPDFANIIAAGLSGLFVSVGVTFVVLRIRHSTLREPLIVQYN